jgi:hypothetical protein
MFKSPEFGIVTSELYHGLRTDYAHVSEYPTTGFVAHSLVYV